MADDQEYGSGEGGKRQAEDQRHNQNKRPRGDFNQITFRLMIRSINAGGVIGKGGENIKRLRSDYDAKVSIPDCNGPERVIKIVTKTLENALDCIKDVIPNIGEKKHSQDQNNYIRVMVHQSHAGAIIGRSGFKIKELREKTGAQFKVYTETCPKSTERVVQLTGTPDIIVKAARAIYEICDETAIKGPVQDYDPFCHDLDFYNRYGGYLFDPAEEGHGDDRGGFGGERGGGGHGGGGHGGQWRGPPMSRGVRGGYDRGMGGGNDSYGYGRSPYGGGGGGGGPPMGGGGGGGGGMGMRGGRGGRGRGGRGMGGSRGGFQRSQHSSDQGFEFGGDSGRGQSNFGSGGSGGGGGSGFEGGAGGGGEAVQTQQVTIPNDLAGSIIGKGGQRIKRIRIQSQAQIKIDDPLQGAKDRIITITGTQQGIAHAKFLLQSSVREYQSGGDGGNQ